MMSKKQMAVETLSYEEAFNELEKIVSTLENETLSLEESLQFYERGQALSKHCAQLLEKAELRLQEIQGANQKTKDGPSEA